MAVERPSNAPNARIPCADSADAPRCTPGLLPDRTATSQRARKAPLRSIKDTDPLSTAYHISYVMQGEFAIEFGISASCKLWVVSHSFQGYRAPGMPSVFTHHFFPSSLVTRHPLLATTVHSSPSTHDSSLLPSPRASPPSRFTVHVLRLTSPLSRAGGTGRSCDHDTTHMGNRIARSAHVPPRRTTGRHPRLTVRPRLLPD